MKKPTMEYGADKLLSLKVFMFASGLNAKDLAKRIDMKPSTLSRKLNGMYDFKLGEVRDIAKALGLTPEETMRIFFETE